MTALVPPQMVDTVRPPRQAVLEPIGSHGVAEVMATTSTARCRCCPWCLTALRCGDLVVDDAAGVRLLDHVNGRSHT